MGRSPMPLLIAAILGLGAGPAEQLHLRVVGVHDGDTITGLDDSKTQYEIRLDAIDAPELGQPFGQASKRALSEKVFGKDVVVIAKTKDKYGRTVGHVMIDCRTVNLAMLEEGMARNNLGLKAPGGWGWLTNPKKAAFNRVYNRTTHDWLLRRATRSKPFR